MRAPPRHSNGIIVTVQRAESCAAVRDSRSGPGAFRSPACGAPAFTVHGKACHVVNRQRRNQRQRRGPPPHSISNGLGSVSLSGPGFLLGLVRPGVATAQVHDAIAEDAQRLSRVTGESGTVALLSEVVTDPGEADDAVSFDSTSRENVEEAPAMARGGVDGAALFRIHVRQMEKEQEEITRSENGSPHGLQGGLNNPAVSTSGKGNGSSESDEATLEARLRQLFHGCSVLRSAPMDGPMQDRRDGGEKVIPLQDNPDAGSNEAERITAPAPGLGAHKPDRAKSMEAAENGKGASVYRRAFEFGLQALEARVRKSQNGDTEQAAIVPPPKVGTGADPKAFETARQRFGGGAGTSGGTRQVAAAPRNVVTGADPEAFKTAQQRFAGGAETSGDTGQVAAAPRNAVTGADPGAFETARQRFAGGAGTSGDTGQVAPAPRNAVTGADPGAFESRN